MMFPESDMTAQFGGVTGKLWWICDKCLEQRKPKWFG